jgi:hypothetical protein
LDLAEAEDAAEVVLAGPEFVEHVGVAVVHEGFRGARAFV